MDVLLTGVVSGLALAIPLGPMAILLIGTTLKHGRGIGVFGALAMATVDFLYAGLVFAFGNAVITALSDWVFALRLTGSAILVYLAIRIFINAKKASAGASASSDGEVNGDGASALKTYAKFFGLTVINPATAFYFVGITPSVSVMAHEGGRGPGLFAFAIGVFLGSIVWQLGLVAAATLTRSFTSPRLQSRLQMIGAALIAILAIFLLVR